MRQASHGYRRLLPSQYSKVVVPVQARKTRRTTGSRISLHPRQGSRYGRPQEADPCHEVPAYDADHAADTRGKCKQRHQMVGGRIVCSPPGKAKPHWGSVLTLGKGAVCATSCRQKLGTKSSTEAELVGVSDILPQVIWTRYFLEAQGYAVNESVVYQDNQSAILLEKNGRASSSKRTRHINMRYFFVTDRVANGEISIEYCPTKTMLADYFTKPLQGIQF